MKKLVFVDESGNPGIKNEQGEFIIAAVVVLDEGTYLKIDSFMDGYKKALGWSDDAEFKFSKTKKQIIIDFLSQITKYNFEVYAVVFNKKSKIDKDKMSLYNRILAKLLLEIGIDDANIVIDGNVGRNYRNKTRAYIRNISRKGFKKFGYGNSKSFNGIQLADLMVGSIHKRYSNKIGSQIFYELIKSKVKFIQEL